MVSRGVHLYILQVHEIARAALLRNRDRGGQRDFAQIHYHARRSLECCALPTDREALRLTRRVAVIADYQRGDGGLEVLRLRYTLLLKTLRRESRDSNRHILRTLIATLGRDDDIPDERIAAVIRTIDRLRLCSRTGNPACRH